MSNTNNQIKKLINTPSAAAHNVTKPLKVIGDGNMLEGVKNIYNYAMTEGEKSGAVRGSIITFSICATLYFLPKGVKFFKKKVDERKSHNEMGEKIYVTFSKNINTIPDEGGILDEEFENIKA